MRYLVVHICVSGFTQSRGTYHGILRLREALIDAGHNSGPARRVWYLPWTANWRQVATDLSTVSSQYGLVPIVTVSGYSYGGYGSLKLCNELESLGIAVRVLTLCDPVGRRWWWPRPLPALTSMLDRDMAFSLPVPATVVELNEFYQKQNRPQGHRTRLLGPTKRGVYKELNYTHQRMDDAQEFHDCVLHNAANIDQEINRTRG